MSDTIVLCIRDKTIVYRKIGIPEEAVKNVIEVAKLHRSTSCSQVTQIKRNVQLEECVNNMLPRLQTIPTNNNNNSNKINSSCHCVSVFVSSVEVLR